MKKIIFTALSVIFLCGKVIFAAENTVVVAGYEFDSPRTSIIAAQMEIHFNGTMDGFTPLNYVNPEDFRNLTAKRNIILKKDKIALAASLEISAVIFIKLADKISGIDFIIEAYGTDIPYNSSLICSLKKTIDTPQQLNNSTYNLISEDVTVQFMIEFLNKYRFPVFGKSSAGEEMYSLNVIEGFKTYSKSQNENGQNIFYFQNYEKESLQLENYFYMKKKEIIIAPANLETTLSLFAITPVLSIISPIATPFLYYSQGKYMETALWAFSSAPYYYLAVEGLLNNPLATKKNHNHETISQFENANFIFAWYQIFAGGSAFFIDAASSAMRYKSSNYLSQESYIANDEYAIFLSLMCGGAGHFYKGSRNWGYFFYHADSILLYSTIYFLSSSEKYSPEKDGYISEKINNEMAILSGAAFAALKSFEIFHLMHTTNSLASGRDTEQLLSFDLQITENGNFNLSAGIKF